MDYITSYKLARIKSALKRYFNKSCNNNLINKAT